MGKIGRIFLTGLMAALPLLLTIFVVVWLLSLINQYLGPSSGFGRLWDRSASASTPPSSSRT